MNPLRLLGSGVRRIGGVLGAAGHNFMDNLEGDVPEVLGADYTPGMRKHLRAQALSNLFASLGSGQPVMNGVLAAQQGTLATGMNNRQQRILNQQAQDMQQLGAPGNDPAYFDRLAAYYIQRGMTKEANEAAKQALEMRKLANDSAPRSLGIETMIDPATGKPVSVQRMSDGTTKAVEGFAPAVKKEITNTGGSILGVDPYTGESAKVADVTIAPGEQARLEQQKAEQQQSIDGIIAALANPATPPDQVAQLRQQLALHAAQKKAGASSVNVTNNIKPVGEDALNRIAEYRSGVAALDSLESTIEKNPEALGMLSGAVLQTPIVGQAAQRLGLFKDAAKLIPQIKLVKQAVGKALEGGVLRKEDEEKYRDILATPEDLPDVALGKIMGLKGKLRTDLQILLRTQGEGGRAVDNFEQPKPATADPKSLRERYKY